MLLKTSTHKTPPCLFTIHNIFFQGRFPEHNFDLTHLPRHHFNPDGVEFFGEFNFLKGGIRYSERINTVSPSYAQEIQTPEYGAGLEGLLRKRSPDLSGILNGIDTALWDPVADPLIPHLFTGDISGWKQACRRALRQELGLEDIPLPLFIMIGRLTHQKGIDLVLDAWEHQAPQAQLAVLGTGEPHAQRRLVALQKRMEGVRVINRFSEPLAHRMQAGADFFLMPSRFEPCGLTQMVAQRYGTIPLVTQTGGLRDTVVPIGPGEDASGIAILTADAAGVSRAQNQAVSLYADPAQLLTLRRRGMSRDFSWARSSRQYKALFDAISAGHHDKRSPLHPGR
jgi:starch synthase